MASADLSAGGVSLNTGVTAGFAAGSGLTVVAWLYRTANASSPFFERPWSKTNSSFTGGFGVAMVSTVGATRNQPYSFLVTSAGLAFAQPAAIPAANTWWLQGTTWDGTTLKNWQNGTVDGSDATKAGTLVEGTEALRIGSGTANEQAATSSWLSFPGYVAHFAVWSVALTAAEMALLAAGVPPLMVRPDALLEYSPLAGHLWDVKRGAALTPTGTVPFSVQGPKTWGGPAKPRLVSYVAPPPPPAYGLNRLINGDFSAGLTSWSTDDPVADTGRSWSVSGGVVTTAGTGKSSMSQTIAVTPGESLVLGLRGAGTLTGQQMVLGGYVVAGAVWLRGINGAAALQPDIGRWPITEDVALTRITVPAGVTSLKIVIGVDAGTTYLTDVWCLIDPDLLINGDFSVDDAVGVPAGWSVAAGTGTWSVVGGALAGSGVDSAVRSDPVTVTPGELLGVAYDLWSPNFDYGEISVQWSDGSKKQLHPAPAIVHSSSVRMRYRAFVTVPAGITTARIYVARSGGGTLYWDRISMRRASQLAQPGYRVECAFGAASSTRSGGDGWIVNDADRGLVGQGAFTPTSTGTSQTLVGVSFTDISAWVRTIHVAGGRPSMFEEYAPLTAAVTLNNDDRRFDPSWAGGSAGALSAPPYAAAGVSFVVDGTPIRIALVDPFTLEHHYLFTGRVQDWPQRWSMPETGVVEIDCVSVAADLNVTVPYPITWAPGSTPSAIIGAALDSIGWPAQWRSFDDTQSSIGIVPEGGTWTGTVLALLQSLAATERRTLATGGEGGAVYVDGGGRVRFRSGGYLARTNVSWLPVGPGVGEVDYDAVPSISTTQTARYNRILATRIGGAVQPAQDVTRGPREWQRSDLLTADDTATLEWASAVLTESLAQPAARINSFDVNPHANSTWWAPLLWMRFGAPMWVAFDPPPLGGPRILQASRVEAIDLRMDALRFGGWKATYGLIPFFDSTGTLL